MNLKPEIYNSKWRMLREIVSRARRDRWRGGRKKRGQRKRVEVVIILGIYTKILAHQRLAYNKHESRPKNESEKSRQTYKRWKSTQKPRVSTCGGYKGNNGPDQPTGSIRLITWTSMQHREKASQ